MEASDVAKKLLSALQKRWGYIFQQQVVNLIAYGSGAFPQTKDKHVIATNTVDLIVEVRSAEYFHHELMKNCPQDYSGAASLFGSRLLEWTQSTVFPMHSNHINLQGKRIKYSIISQQYLRDDLRNWKYLSFAGRLQKPILPIKQFSDGILQDINRNKEIAAAVALLLYGGKGIILSQFDFFCKVCELSYMGDVRFAAGAENPNKIENIVNHNYSRFQDLYIPILKRFSLKIPTSLTIEQNNISFLYTAQSLAFLLPHLPSSLLDPISQLYPGQKNLVERVLLGGSAQLPRDLKDIISKINRRSSFWMASQNLVAASPINNLKYLAAKWKKSKNK